MECRVVAESEPELVAELRGELVGEKSAAQLARFVEGLCRRDGERLVRLDLAELTWIDIDGIQALFLLRRHAARAGKRLVVMGAHGWVQKKLRQTGVLASFAGEGHPSQN